MKTNFFLFILLTLFFDTGYCQSEIGIKAGMNQSGFYGWRNVTVLYAEAYKYHVNYTASVFYKEVLTDKLVAGFEFQNINVKSSIGIGIQGPVAFSSGFYALTELNYLNLHFLFGRKLLSIKRTEISLAVSPYFGYLLHSKAIGYGFGPGSVSYIDSLGQTHSYISEVTYKINGSHSRLTRNANIGLSLDLGARFPVNNRLSLLIDGAYHFGIYNVVKEANFIGIRGYTATAGVSYQLSKQYIHFMN